MAKKLTETNIKLGRGTLLKEAYISENTGSFVANSGTQYPGVTFVADAVVNLFLAFTTIQASDGRLTTIVSLLTIFNYNGLTKRGSSELARFENGGQITPNTIDLEARYSRLQIAIPNIATSYNWKFGYFKLS